MKEVVAIVVNSYFNFENFRLHLAKSFVSCGYKVVIITPRPNKNMVKYYSGIDYRFIELAPLSTSITKNFWQMMHLVMLLRELRPVYLLSFTIKPNIYCGLYKIFDGHLKFIPTITGIGSALYKNGREKLLWIRLLMVAILRSHCVLVQNDDDLKLLKKHRLNEVPVKVVNGSGINVDLFADEERDRGTRRLLFLGRLIKDKGADIFMKCALNMRNENYNYTFTVVGNLDFKDPRSLKKDLYLEFLSLDNCEHVDHTNNVKKVLSEHDILILPSSREGCSRAILEACASRVIVIASNVPGCNNIIDNDCGFLLNTRSVDEVTKALSLIRSKSKQNLDELRDCAFEKVKRCYSEIVVQETYLDIMRNNDN